MFDNWVSIAEIGYLLKKIQRDPEAIRKVMRSIPFLGSKKVASVWTNARFIHSWTEIPAVQERINYKISGNEKVNLVQYTEQQYMLDRANLHGLSLGCGSGMNELAWLKTQRFSRFDAFDLSPNRISQARCLVEQEGFHDIAHFDVGDISTIALGENRYDWIFCQGSLHHFSPLASILRKIQTALKPEGFFLFYEYAGPTRFQWTNHQLSAINGILEILPNKYKTLQSGYVKPSLVRPSKLGMVIRDPSEAIESEKILPLVSKLFQGIEQKGCGGTILHPLMHGIAQNFLAEEAQPFIHLIFEIEDLLIKEGVLVHDFVFAVCKKM